MKNKPKFVDVLLYLNERKFQSIHYLELQKIIYSDEVIKKNRSWGKIDRITCLYLGRLSRKDYISAEYKTVGNCAYFVGYYIRENGIKFLKDNGYIE